MAKSLDARVPEAERLYQEGMRLCDIAAKLGIPAQTVRTWKRRYGWDKIEAYVEAREKTEARAETIVETQPEELTENEELFCQEYCKRFNATRAYMSVYRCEYSTAAARGCRLIQKDSIRQRIKELKKERIAESLLDPADIFQKYMDIAFADVDDFIFHDIQVLYDEDGHPHEVEYTRLRTVGEYDGQLVSNIKMGKFGAEIQPPTVSERMKALDWLADHIGMATEDQKTRMESLKSKIKLDQAKIDMM